MTFKLQDLPFPQDSLAPHMSAKTLSFHHGKHHKAYVDKLNAAVEGTAFAGKKLEEIIKNTANDAAQKGIFNNAAQHWNHSFFWSCLTPGGGGKPEGELARQIDADFGSYDKFKKAFGDVAAGQFGSGWAWFVVDGGKLKVIATANAELPLMFGQNALLTCDVWEHAYYLDYQNRRPDFVEAFLNKMVNWSFASERFARQGEGAPQPNASRKHRSPSRPQARLVNCPRDLTASNGHGSSHVMAGGNMRNSFLKETLWVWKQAALLACSFWRPTFGP